VEIPELIQMASTIASVLMAAEHSQSNLNPGKPTEMAGVSGIMQTP
jgi:hypothetical protein